MPPATSGDSIQILPATDILPTDRRRREPITLGVPLPRGLVTGTESLRLARADNSTRPLQTRALNTWPDGSIRWVLLDFQADAADGAPGSYRLRTGDDPALETPTGVTVSEAPDHVRVSSGALTVTITRGGAFPFAAAHVDSRRVLADDTPGLAIDIDGRHLTWTVADIEVVERGPLRAEVVVRGTTTPSDSPPLEVTGRLECFSSTPTVRLNLTMRNPRRAIHPGGQWPLGDPGSLLLQSASVAFKLAAPAASIEHTLAAAGDMTPVAAPFHLLQASSGGDHWQAPTHLTREDRVALPFRGYRLRAGDDEDAGHRASPTVRITTPAGALSLAPIRFWEEFPKAIAIDGDMVTLGMLPADSGDVHELQGGEQTTHTFALVFGDDPVSTTPLAWCHAPLRFHPAPDDVSRTGAIPCLLPAADDPHPAYLSLVEIAFDAERGFFAKREAADEYGWRHFGDLAADHESAFQPPDRPFVSHYNNQYDAIAGFALHFLRTGDGRWWTLMDDLARHVRDIDVYHTDEDKAAYNHGLFWHTNHYVDAGTSTHRTYPQGGASGGGPSAEHNYNYGLMLHYFLTGDRRSKETAIALGQWVIDMDDGQRTPFRWLTRGATGLASASGPGAYQGAGRGAGHSILACLVAHQVTGSAAFLTKAETLIRRCVHPHETVPMQYVEDIEGYWSYTAFLQVVGLYLRHKEELGQIDDAFAYARASLLNHARWMAAHERPYLDRRERLDYPTETWVAQDLRKADVFMWAATHSADDERRLFSERALHFFHYATRELPRMAGHWFSRPLVLVLTQGHRIGWFVRHGGALAPPVDVHPPPVFPPARTFRPQKAIAMRRAVTIGLVMAATVLVGAAYVISLWWS